MGYVVVVCSKCKLAKGADEKQKTATCPSCGRTLHLADLKKYYHAETLPEIRDAIGRLNAKLKGGLDAYLEDAGMTQEREGEPGPHSPISPPQDEFDRTPPMVQDGPFRLSKVDDRILKFLDKKGISTTEQIFFGLSGTKLTMKKLEERLTALCGSGYIFEPSVGKYKLVK